MHLAIRYQNLKPAQKFAIYENLLAKIPDSNISGDRDKLYENIKEYLCKRDAMNGRQIRNIVTTALALAKSDGSSVWKLSYKHLRTVHHETTSDFVESLKDLTQTTRERSEADEIE